MFYYSHIGHVGCQAGSSDTFFKLDKLMLIVTKFGKICLCCFRRRLVKETNVKFDFKGSIDRFCRVTLFEDLTLLNIIAVYSLSLYITIFKIITKNCNIFLKFQVQGQYPNNELSDFSKNLSANRSWPAEQF